MRKLSLLSAAAIALLTLPAPNIVKANGLATAPLADYNAAQVALAGGIVTVPFGGLIANAVYTVSNGTTLEQGSSFTLTLPSTFLFQAVPTLTATGGATLAVTSGGVGSNFATYLISSAAVPAAGTVTVGPFTVYGATALESQFGGNPLPLTFQATNNVTPGNNDATALSVPVFVHAVGSLPDTITPGSGHINVASTPIATQFIPNGATIAGSAQVATFAINTELNDPFNSNAPVLSPDGSANSLNSSDTANITVEGDFTGIVSAYANTTIATCSATIPGGSFVGIVTTGSLTFNLVPINTPVQICMIPDGVTTLHGATTPYVYTYSAGTGVTDFFGGLAQTTANNFYTYSTPLPVASVVVSPASSDTLYAAVTGAGVYTSTNGGTSWSRCGYGSGSGITSTNVVTLTVNAAGVVFVGTSDAGVFSSSNGCSSWTAMNTGLPT